jgi:serine/threonine-protein kinase
MPDVVGLAAAEAVRVLQERKLTPVIEQVPSSEPPGTVLTQKPEAGKRAKPGTRVVLEVARGEAAVPVPDATGQSEQQAASTLQQSGLTARIVRVPSTQPKGTVVAQKPAAGEKAPKGAAVRLNVSRGASPQTTTRSATPAPPSSGNDYTGMRVGQAVQKIAEGRQQAIVVYVTSSQPAGVVVANSKAGSRERLQVSAGPNPHPARDVPDVAGEDAATAQQDLQAAGFSVVEVQWPVSDHSLEGTVVYETPSGGQQAPQGSAIVIYVATVNG